MHYVCAFAIYTTNVSDLELLVYPTQVLFVPQYCQTELCW